MSSVVLSPTGLTQDAPDGIAEDVNLRERYLADSERRLTAYFELLGLKAHNAKRRDKNSMQFLWMWTGYNLPRIEDVVPHLF